ncbi:interleukin-6 receptor subunit alpha isoform X1 [Labrus mixtus]|uniref:interleukin-6 receptor subunit alpha isoform X1 n=1 Tax=Labrus mixtus TaxID=508554 RepID=UPI0029C0C2DF|nr:interleukin-6 receptor subunit alpha isoform X1 [Labrus mixtus]
MQIFPLLMFVLCAEPVRCIFEGTCPRKEPPPGVLVLSPGSKLVLTCSGHVKVDGVKVSMSRNSSNVIRRTNSSDENPITVNISNDTGVVMKSEKQTTKNAVNEGNPTEAEENKVITHANTGYTVSPTTHNVQKSRVSWLLKSELNLDAEEVEGRGGFEEEEDEEGSRVTRGIKRMHHWKWNGKTVGKGHRDWREVTLDGRGETLSLSSAKVTDSGKYACYYKSTQMFSLRVTVADPPETPSLSCYKRSPSSKIRCEWTPQKVITVTPDCYLFLSKKLGRNSEPFHRLQCSYSLRLSRCWCALDFNEDQPRTLHRAYLCVTSIAGNATSSLQHFRPLSILKPDPPSHVSVRQEVGKERGLKVTWSFPRSWKSQDNFYELIYEIKYRPRQSSFQNEQVHVIKEDRFYTITDAMPGVEYLIQLRTTEEFDGLWSDWSTPVNASSWTAPSVPPLTSTTFPLYSEGSGDEEEMIYVIEPVFTGSELSSSILWISGSFVLVSIVLAAYIFRYKDRFVSKLQSVVTKCGDSPQPQHSVQSAPEVKALVTFAPPGYKEPQSSEMGEDEDEDEDDEEEEQVKERMESLHFNNTSYFFLQT